MPNYNIKLSHHDKRSVAWKILVATALFFAVMMLGGYVHYSAAIVDPAISIWFVVVAFISIGMFGLGYMMRDKLPARMGTRCKRFYYMGQEFGIWHWSRAQVLLADIFLVALTSAIYGWSAAHSIPLFLAGTSYTDTVPFLYIPMFYVQFWMEILVEAFLIFFTVMAFVYETRTWILSKRADFCHFEGINDSTPGMLYDCDPGDAGCILNKNFG
jgi:hypothetical protein